MPIQIQIPVDRVVKKLKKLVAEVTVVVREKDIYLLAMDEAQTFAVYARIGENIGENPQQIIIDASELAKLEAVRADIDIGEDGVLKVSSITKSGVEVEKTIASFTGEKPLELIEKLIQSGTRAHVLARASELKDMLEQVIEESNEAKLILKDGRLRAEATGITEKVRKVSATIKPEESSGVAELRVNAEVLYTVVDAISTFLGKVKLEITEEGVLRLRGEGFEIYGLLAPLAEQT